MLHLSTVTAFKSLNMDGIGIPIEGDNIRRCQLVMLSIAEDIVKFCEEEGIWYELGGGTALGALRHGGFIPWDDDIDMNILGKDFERLGKGMERKYGNKYSFHYYNTPGYGLPMGRIVLKDSVYRDRDTVRMAECGFFVDIFPVENVPNNPFLRKLHGCLCQLSGGILSCRKFYGNRSFMRQLASHNPSVKQSVSLKIALGSLVSFLSLETCAKITDCIYGLCNNNNSEYVAIPSGRKHYFGEMYKRTALIDTIPVSFEGHRWQIAKDYDGYFTRLYGPTYMTPHTVQEREHHVVLDLKFPGED